MLCDDGRDAVVAVIGLKRSPQALNSKFTIASSPWSYCARTLVRCRASTSHPAARHELRRQSHIGDEHLPRHPDCTPCAMSRTPRSHARQLRSRPWLRHRVRATTPGARAMPSSNQHAHPTQLAWKSPPRQCVAFAVPRCPLLSFLDGIQETMPKVVQRTLPAVRYGDDLQKVTTGFLPVQPATPVVGIDLAGDCWREGSAQYSSSRSLIRPKISSNSLADQERVVLRIERCRRRRGSPTTRRCRPSLPGRGRTLSVDRRPRISARNVADSSLSRTHRIEWLS